MSDRSAAAGAYRLFADGAARGNPGPAAYGYVLDAPDGTALAEVGEAIGHATNNVAEYRGLIAGLERALALGVTELDVRMDSELVVRQMAGEYRVRHPGLIPLHARARDLVAQLTRCTIRHVVRERNRRADALANRALDALRRGRGGEGRSLPGDRGHAGDGESEESPSSTGQGAG